LYTPARSLADVLTAVSHEPNAHRLFGDVAAEILGLNDRDADVISLMRMRALIFDCERLIESLAYDEKHKNVAREHLSPFVALRNMSAFQYNIDQARSGILQPAPIAGLRNLHMILHPVAYVGGVDEKKRSEIADVFALCEGIHDLNLPEMLKEAILKRLTQVIDSMNNFEFLGEINLEEKLDALLGKITLASSEADKPTKEYLKRVLKVVCIASAGLIGVSETAEAYLSLTNSIPEILSLPAPENAE
jgi:hypothetical protein